MNARVSHAIFGAADGMTSLIGVLAGLAVAHATPGTMLTTVGGLAVAAGVSMGAGDFLGGSSLGLSVVMGVATLIGSVVPAVPALVIHGPWGYRLTTVLAVLMALVIAEARHGATERARHGFPPTRLRTYTITLAILLGASLLAIWTTIALGAIGG